MEKDLYQEVEKAFMELNDLAQEERLIKLQKIEKDNPKIALELRSLFDHEKSMSEKDFLEVFPSELLAEEKLEIDGFEILEPLGEGGMGQVFKAQQQIPFKRFVAIKFLKSNLFSHVSKQRFKLEVETLAHLNHPYIAQVFQAGATEKGTPFVVLEFVPGKNILEFCDSHRMTLDERIDLFQKILQGVSYSHRELVIHRDLKPGNILVFQEGNQVIPKIIDFGLAKHLNPEDSRSLTQSGLFAGSLAYMAPEQFQFGTLTPKTDIYSLGVILHQLLSGIFPNNRSTANMIHVIHDFEHDVFLLPSLVLNRTSDKSNEISVNRSSTKKGLVKALKGDLDCILAKALSHNPDYRYESIEAFSNDLDLYQKAEPISARPFSMKKRMTGHLRKFKMTWLIVFALVLLGTLGMKEFQNIQNQRNEVKIVKKAFRTIQEIKDQLDVAKMLPIHDISHSKDLVREKLKTVEKSLPEYQTEEAKSEIYRILGYGYYFLDDMGKAVHFLEKVSQVDMDTGEANYLLGVSSARQYIDSKRGTAFLVDGNSGHTEDAQLIKVRTRLRGLLNLEKKPELISVPLLESYLFLLEDNFKGAEEKALQVRSKLLNPYEADLLLSDIYNFQAKTQKQDAESVRLFQKARQFAMKAIEVGRSDPRAYLQYGVSLYGQAWCQFYSPRDEVMPIIEEAISVFDQGLSIDSQFIQLWGAKAFVQKYGGQFEFQSQKRSPTHWLDEAETTIMQAESRFGQHPLLESVLGDVFLQRALYLDEKDEDPTQAYLESNKHYEVARKLLKTNTWNVFYSTEGLKIWSNSNLIHLAQYLERKNRPYVSYLQQVFQPLETILTQDPNNIELNQELGKAYCLKAKYEESIQKDALPSMLRAGVLFETTLKFTNDRQYRLRDLAKLNLQIYDYMNYRGQNGQDYLKKAHDFLQEAKQLSPQVPWNYYELGMVFRSMGLHAAAQKSQNRYDNFDKARAEFESMLKLNSYYSPTHLYLAESLYYLAHRPLIEDANRLKLLGSALDHLNKFRLTNPQSPEEMILHAKCLLELPTRKDQANSQNPEVKVILKNLISMNFTELSLQGIQSEAENLLNDNFPDSK